MHCLVAALVLSSGALLFAAAAPKPPVAPIVPHTETRHGTKVTDNYFWLREKSNSKVTAYLNAENAYTEAVTAPLKPFESALYKEMLGHIKQTDLSVPVRRGPYRYYTRSEEGKQYPIYCRRKGEGMAEEIILDQNQLAIGQKFTSITPPIPSDDQNLIAYTIDHVGYRQYHLGVTDLRTGKRLADTAERVTSLAWAADNKTLFLVTEDPVNKRSNKLWRHVLGTNSLDALYEEKDEQYAIEIEKTRDRSYLILNIESKDTTEAHYLAADRPREGFRLFLGREKKHRYYIDHRAGLFYIRTDRNALNFRIMTAPDSDPAEKNWKPFVPHREDTRISRIDLFRHFAVVSEKSQALDHLRLYDFDSGKWSSIAFPEPVYSAEADENPDFDTAGFRYRYRSFIIPESVYDYDPQSGTSKLLKRQEVPGYDPALYTSERLWAVARDGANVPLSIVHRKGFRQDGTKPLFLYAYGSYGFGSPPAFSPSRLALLDRGMAYAIAHIRGGDEMGESWRRDGMLMNKKNTFFDFIDSAQYLIDGKWTSKDKLVIEGASAGGLLMGAAVNMRPDLFCAVHMGVPFVDVMNDMMDPSLPLTTEEYLEWGNPNDKTAYDYMLGYSPYDNLHSGSYPAILVTESFNDSQVFYWEAAKYVAKLRTLKSDNRPLLLKMKMDPAGHGGASGRYDRLHDTAFEYAWLLSQVGITH
jgi:oligopeptidase B